MMMYGRPRYVGQNNADAAISPERQAFIERLQAQLRAQADATMPATSGTGAPMDGADAITAGDVLWPAGGALVGALAAWQIRNDSWLALAIGIGLGLFAGQWAGDRWGS